MSYFPFFEDISDKKFLIIGGGKIASNKLKVLEKFGANVTLISEQICDEIKKYPIKLLNQTYSSPVINDYDYVIAATNNKDLNRQISTDCKEHNIPVNVVDNKELSTFIFPALLHNEAYTIAVGTEGKSPYAAKYIRDYISDTLPDDLASIIDWMGSIRSKIMQQDLSEAERSALFKKLFLMALADAKPLSEEKLDKELKNER